MKARQAWLAALLYAVMTLAWPAAAQLAPGPRHVAMHLVAETAAPAAGSTIDLAIAARPDPGWHGYWQNPGDAGTATTLDWTLPAGLRVGPLRYPLPQRLLVAGLMNYVYEGPYAQLVALKLPPGLAVGTRLPIAVTVVYLVCTRSLCVPERQTLTTAVTIGDGTVAATERARFDGWRRALPVPLGSPARFAVADGGLRLAVSLPAAVAADDAYFYPLTGGAIAYAAPQTISRDGDTLTIATTAGPDRPAAIAGVLAAGGRGFVVRAMPGPVAATATAGGVVVTGLAAFLGALVGGLILNVMPCVFPILSLKALGLARSAQSERHARGEALAYTAGIVLVCVALGGSLLLLRASGASVGWAFQLQDPRVILMLLLLVSGIALNLAGLFEVATPDVVNRAAAGGVGGGAGGAFATGALAAFVATPCTGPFMGAALGAALVLPTAAALLVFAGLGLGIALPFLAIGFVPALRQRLPRPGPWMATLRRVLAVPMFATALALAWVLGRQAGVSGMTLGLGAVLLLGLGLWWSGRRQAGGSARAWLPGAVAAVLSLGTLALVARAPAAGASVAAGPERFSEARLAALRGRGRPVFAYFTADWCLTCKVNERVAIDTDAVREAFAAGGVATLVGDWTDGDPALGRFIEAHNRAGVPLYLWYPAGDGEAHVLPQVLTPATLTALVRRSKA